MTARLTSSMFCVGLPSIATTVSPIWAVIDPPARGANLPTSKVASLPSPRVNAPVTEVGTFASPLAYRLCICARSSSFAVASSALQLLSTPRLARWMTHLPA